MPIDAKRHKKKSEKRSGILWSTIFWSLAKRVIMRPSALVMKSVTVLINKELSCKFKSGTSGGCIKETHWSPEDTFK